MKQIHPLITESLNVHSDEDFRVMWENGSDVSAMAEKLEQTERGDLDRARFLEMKER